MTRNISAEVKIPLIPLIFEDIYELFRPSFKMAYSLAREGFAYASLIVIVTSFEITCRECIVYALTKDKRRLKVFGEKTFKLKDLVETKFSEEEIVRKLIRSIDFQNLTESNAVFRRAYNFKLKDVAQSIGPYVWTILNLTILLRHQIVHHGGHLNEAFTQRVDNLLKDLGEEERIDFLRIIGNDDVEIDENLNIKILTNMESFLNEILNRVAKEFGISQ